VRRIDLHAHTDHSDGTLSPVDLVRAARDAGLAALAVTDHDTTSGLREALEEGVALGVEVLTGCEISAKAECGAVHVLAYGFDPGEASFQAFLRRVREGRDRRNVLILERLAGLGIPVTLEEVLVFVKGRIVARPHFARALVQKGYVEDVRAAFTLYLRDGGPAFAAADMPPPEEAVRVVRAAGGVTALAHPGQLRLEGREAYAVLLRSLAGAGLGGLEVMHPSHDQDARRMFADLAREVGLVATGGSDFHGENKPHIRLGVGDGTIEVGYETWERLRARRGP
jgi:hypothetical protein